MENQFENQREVEIDIIDLFYYLKKKILVIISALLSCMVLGFVVSTFMITPKYTATTRIYVLNRSSENAVIYSDYVLSEYMASDYIVLITGQNVTKQVIEELNLDMTYSQLANKISVKTIDETRVLQIAVSDTDPQRAAEIANCICRVASVQLQEIVNVEAVNVVYEAEVPTHHSSPNVKKNMILAGALGFIIAIGVYIVIYLADDTIRNEDDVERYLGLSVLGVIPLSEEIAKFGNRSVTGKKKKKLSSRKGLSKNK